MRMVSKQANASKHTMAGIASFRVYFVRKWHFSALGVGRDWDYMGSLLDWDGLSLMVLGFFFLGKNGWRGFEAGLKILCMDGVLLFVLRG